MRDAPPALRRALPPAVVAWAHRCGAQMGETALDHVVFTQTGAMRADGAHRWAPFTAHQTMALDRVGFAWRARTGPLGCIAITDALAETGGLLTVKALGVIPLARVPANAALTKGELQRYLAEIPLAPDAILRNASLDWEVLDPSTFRVSARLRDVQAHVDLTLGADGQVSTAFAPDRPRMEGAEHPWTGHFRDYRPHEGRQLPFAAECGWTIAGEEVAYWRGAIETWTLKARR